MEKSPDEELADTIYSVCLSDGPNSLGKVYTERELKKATEYVFKILKIPTNLFSET